MEESTGRQRSWFCSVAADARHQHTFDEFVEKECGKALVLHRVAVLEQEQEQEQEQVQEQERQEEEEEQEQEEQQQQQQQQSMSKEVTENGTSGDVKRCCELLV